MNLEEKQKFIFFRLKEAEESLKDAELLLQNKSYRSSVNRSYYSMFYGILALINITGISISKHTGVISHFDKEFVKTGIFSKEFSKSLHSAFELRQESDYLDMKEVTLEETEAILLSAKSLFSQIKDYLRVTYSLFYP
ncbi:MAG: HEPN domain-containing protein [Leptospiraceae bacterium]|nr:HEPN domain-containing protein [Leptospiraceae bacterium]